MLKYYPTSGGKNKNISILLVAIDNENVASYIGSQATSNISLQKNNHLDVIFVDRKSH